MLNVRGVLGKPLVLVVRVGLDPAVQVELHLGEQVVVVPQGGPRLQHHLLAVVRDGVVLRGLIGLLCGVLGIVLAADLLAVRGLDRAHLSIHWQCDRNRNSNESEPQ